MYLCVFFIVSGCCRLFTEVEGRDQDLKMFSLQDSSQKGAIMLDIGFVPPQFPASLSHKATWRPFDSFRFNMQWFIILCYSTIWELSFKLYGCPSDCLNFRKTLQYFHVHTYTCFSLHCSRSCHCDVMLIILTEKLLIFKLSLKPFTDGMHGTSIALVFPNHCVCVAQHKSGTAHNQLHGRRTRFCLDAALCDHGLAWPIAGYL